MSYITIGGDRIHSGNKMQAPLPTYERSNSDLSQLFQSTMSAGTLVPCLTEIMLPGDTFDVTIGMKINTHPTVGPLFGNFKAVVDLFTVPMRLYNSLITGNYYNAALNMGSVDFPLVVVKGYQVLSADEFQINPSCVLAYLGIRGVGNSDGGNQDRNFNAVPLVGYYDIYRTFYANKQENKGCVIHNIPASQPYAATDILVDGIDPNTGNPVQVSSTFTVEIQFGGVPAGQEFDNYQITVNGNSYVLSSICSSIFRSGTNTLTGTIPNFPVQSEVTSLTLNTSIPVNLAPVVNDFNLNQLDEFLYNVRSENGYNITYTDGFEPMQWLLSEGTPFAPRMCSQEGLLLKTYNSDLFNNWLNTASITNITTMTRVSTVGNSFTIDALSLAKKLYQVQNAVLLNGGSYSNWIQAVYDFDRYYHQNTPKFEGSLIKDIIFEEVVSTNAQSSGDPLGSLAGRGVVGQRHQGGQMVIRADEPQYLIGIVHITPNIVYSQGNKWDVNVLTFDDLHKPGLDGIGFQDLITEQMAYFDTKYNGATWVQRSAGKQPAWQNYRTAVNRVYGNFAIPSNEMFMTLNRRYEFDGDGIADLTTYIDPAKYNFIFAQTERDAQNFWVQVGFNIHARRKMSQKIIPNP